MVTTLTPGSLEIVLDYQNENVVYRFMTLFDVGFDEANDVFGETKKWLWLVSQPDAPDLAIVDGMFIIDEMWHNFVLFTRDYIQFCQDHFGRFVHHLPATRDEKREYQERFSRDPIGLQEEEMVTLARRCAYIQRKLGTSTLLKWFVEYPQTFDESFFNHRRMPVTVAYSPPAELCALADQINNGHVLVMP